MEENPYIWVEKMYCTMDLNDIIKLYEEQNDCPYDFLEFLPVPEGMTFGAAFEMYISIMYEIDRDTYYRLTDDLLINLNTGEERELDEDTDLSLLP